MKQNLTPENLAAQSHRFSLQINWGGLESATVYFDIESDGEDNASWQVSDGLQIFYKDAEITNLFETYDVSELIYAKDKQMETQIEDQRINEMAEYHRPYDD
jgi:hypothetical protein